jgi:hypothetical protein
MNDMLRVTMLKCRKNASDNLCGKFFGISLTFSLKAVKAIKKLTPTAKLHNQVQVFDVIVSFKILDDIWMVQSLKNAHFIHDVFDFLSR